MYDKQLIIRKVIVWQSVIICLLISTCLFLNSLIMVRDVNKDELHSVVSFCNSAYGGFGLMTVHSSKIIITCADGTSNYLTR